MLSRLFRWLFNEQLIALLRTRDLVFNGLADASAFAAWPAPFRKSGWLVYSKLPFGGSEAVLAYPSRYTHPLPGHGLQGKP